MEILFAIIIILPLVLAIPMFLEASPDTNIDEGKYMSDYPIEKLLDQKYLVIYRNIDKKYYVAIKNEGGEYLVIPHTIYTLYPSTIKTLDIKYEGWKSYHSVEFIAINNIGLTTNIDSEKYIPNLKESYMYRFYTEEGAEEFIKKLKAILKKYKNERDTTYQNAIEKENTTRSIKQNLGNVKIKR